MHQFLEKHIHWIDLLHVYVKNKFFSSLSNSWVDIHANCANSWFRLEIAVLSLLMVVMEAFFLVEIQLKIFITFLYSYQKVSNSGRGGGLMSCVFLIHFFSFRECHWNRNQSIQLSFKFLHRQFIKFTYIWEQWKDHF